MNVRELKSVSISRNEDDQLHEAWLKSMENSFDKGKSALALHAKASETLRSLRNKYKDDLSLELGADLSKYRAFQEKRKARAFDLQPVFAPTAEGQLLKKSIRSQSAREASELSSSIGAHVDKTPVEGQDRHGDEEDDDGQHETGQQSRPVAAERVSGVGDESDGADRAGEE